MIRGGTTGSNPLNEAVRNPANRGIYKKEKGKMATNKVR
jgi:hypothetical protein